MSRTRYLRPLVLLLAAALAVSVLMVLWPTLAVQAQSDSIDNATGDDPGEVQYTDTGGDSGDPQSTGKYLIAFGGNTLPTDYEQRISDLGGTVENQYQEIGVVVASGLSEDAAERLESFEDVDEVAQDVERRWIDPVEATSAEATSVDESSVDEPSAEATSVDAPNTADYYSSQWHLRAIGADKAWVADRKGSAEVTVAIVDTGIDGGRNDGGRNSALWAHPDVRGLVDRTLSKSFVPSEDTLVKATFPNAPEWTDLNFHGTHVAATVSSKADAAAGVTSKVKLMAVKVLDVNQRGSASGVLDGVMYAADHADVINLSLGGSFTKKDNADPAFVSVINRAINYANEKGTTIVASAGNENRDLKAKSNVYQAYCQSPHVVCVSATGPTSGGTNGPWSNVDAKASYSNYGSPITVAAPGGNGNSPVWAACPRTSLAVPVCRTGTFVLGLNGTSMAAPHATGLAALLVEDIGKGQPSQVAAQIRKSADDLGDPKKDVIYGDGRINVAKALRLQQPSP